MKVSTLLLIIAAAGIWLHIFMPAKDKGPAELARSGEVPRVTLVGKVMERAPEGLIISCSRETGGYTAVNGVINGFGRFLVKGHPDEAGMHGGEVLTVQGVDEGSCYSSGELLQTYRCVASGAAAEAPPSAGKWHSVLEDPSTHAGGGSR